MLYAKIGYWSGPMGLDIIYFIKLAHVLYLTYFCFHSGLPINRWILKHQAKARSVDFTTSLILLCPLCCLRVMVSEACFAYKHRKWCFTKRCWKRIIPVASIILAQYYILRSNEESSKISLSLKYIYLNLNLTYISKDYLLQKWEVLFGNIICVLLFLNYKCLLFWFS
jgi:hypothetical protein